MANVSQQHESSTISAFRYEAPKMGDGQVKTIVNLCRTRLLSAGVQLVKQGGETTLHAHNTEDEIWLVLSGRAAFYGKDNERVEVSRHEGVLVEASVEYWFESLGDEPLEILRVSAKDPKIEPKASNPVPEGRALASIVTADAIEVTRAETSK